jgi:hypothetical protein
LEHKIFGSCSIYEERLREDRSFGDRSGFFEDRSDKLGVERSIMHSPGYIFFEDTHFSHMNDIFKYKILENGTALDKSEGNYSLDMFALGRTSMSQDFKKLCSSDIDIRTGTSTSTKY